MAKLKRAPLSMAQRKELKRSERADRIMLMTLPPHLCLKLFREGEATQENWEVVCFRTTVGKELAFIYFNEDAAQLMYDAEMILRNIYARACHNGVWSATEEEFNLFGLVLNLTDEMHELTTPQEQMPAYMAAAHAMNLFTDPELASQVLNDPKIFPRLG